MNEYIWLTLLLASCAGFGLLRRFRDGRAKQVSLSPRVDESEIGGGLGEAATLVQFSTAFCAPCRQTRSMLGRIADTVPGVSHVEVDAEANLELVRKLDIRRTPTTLLVDADGVVRNRVVGVPQTEQLLAALVEVSAR